jgi:hypothetical protein
MSINKKIHRSPLTFHVSRLSRLKRPGEMKSDAHREREREVAA